MINSNERQPKGKENVFIIRKYDFLKKKSNISSKKRIPWKSEEDELLIRLVNKRQLVNWNDIAKHFESRTNIQCEERWNKVLKPGLKKGKWSQEEDELLLNFVKKYGPYNWAKLAVVLKGRTPKQIRDRWINNLNPKRIHFSWSNDLDKILLENYLKYGSKWTLISQQIYGTTENVVKNRFYSLLRSTAIRHSSKKVIKEETYDYINSFKQEEDIKNNSFEEIDKYFNLFEFEDINKSTLNDKSITKVQEKVTKKPKKRVTFSLAELLKFVPYLLEERGIDVEATKKDVIKEVVVPKEEESIPSESTNQEQTNLVDANSTFTTKMLTFNNILEKIENKSKQNSMKIKSSILLNLQLTLLNRIFHRLKTQIVQKFFESFKGNTLDTL